MKNKRLIYIILIIIGVVVVYSRGYYTRNFKVDDVFLTTIAQSISTLEIKRINNDIHSYEDYRQMRRLLNDGEMGENSNAEIEIGFGVQGMSKCLYEYYEALTKNNLNEAEEKIKSYRDELVKLEKLLNSYRKDNASVEELWANGVFK